MSEVALHLFGVPLPVVMASAAGAFLARSYLPSVGFARAAWFTIVWSGVGSFLAPVAQFLITKFAGVELPSAALAGCGLVVSAGAPLLWPIVIAKLPQIVTRWLDRLGEKKDDRQH